MREARSKQERLSYAWCQCAALKKNGRKENLYLTENVSRQQFQASSEWPYR